MPEDDVIRTIRFKAETWKKMLKLVDDFDRSPNWIVNKLVNDHGTTGETRQKGVKFPPPSPDAGVTTYVMHFEVQLPAMVWSDKQADEVFLSILCDLKDLTPNNQEAWGMVNAIRPMEYNPATSNPALPGYRSRTEAQEVADKFSPRSNSEGVKVKDGSFSPFTQTPQELDDAAAEALDVHYRGKPNLPEPTDPWARPESDGVSYPEESADYQIVD